MNQQTSKTLYSGGIVFDGHESLGRQDVLVVGGRIERVAPPQEFAGFADRRVDIGGCTLLPGIIDCHVHLCYSAEADPGTAADKLAPGAVAVRALENARDTLHGGVTAVRDCGGKDYLEFAARDACNSGRFLGPTIQAAGRMICMTGGHGNRIGRVADGEQEVVKAVREQIHAGCDFCKLMATGGVMTKGVDPEDAHYSEAELAAGIGEARRFKRKTASHAQGSAGILNAVRAGIDSIEHGIFMDQACLEAMLKGGVFLVPTCAALHNIVANADQGIPDFMVEKSRRVAERHRQSIKMFFAAGGKVAMGTDAGTPFNRHGENTKELEFMVECGVSLAGALQASTAHGAELMGLQDRGRVVAGYHADLLVVEGDPLTDIGAVANRANHRLVVKNGISAWQRETR